MTFQIPTDDNAVNDTSVWCAFEYGEYDVRVVTQPALGDITLQVSTLLVVCVETNTERHVSSVYFNLNPLAAHLHAIALFNNGDYVESLIKDIQQLTCHKL